MLKVGLDIDDTLGDFFGPYKKRFKADKNPNALVDHVITRNVYSLRKDRNFWLSLPKISDLNFEPELYCTKRINPKSWTRKWLLDNGFPDKPIYQMYYQKGNKADMIKGRCDVLIDDSVSNVLKCIESGLPAILIDRSHNQGKEVPARIYSLDLDEIVRAYKKHF